MSLLQSNNKCSFILLNINLVFEININLKEISEFVKNILDWFSISRI